MRNASAWNISHGIHRFCSYHTTHNISEHIVTNYAHTHTHTNRHRRYPFSLYFSLYFSLPFSLYFSLYFSLSFSLYFSLYFSLAKPADYHREPFSLYFSLHFSLHFSLNFSLHLSLHFSLAKPADYHINSLTSAIGVVGAIEDHPEPTVHDLPPPDPAAVMDGHPCRAAEGVADHILKRKEERRRKKEEDREMRKTKRMNETNVSRTGQCRQSARMGSSSTRTKQQYSSV